MPAARPAPIDLPADLATARPRERLFARSGDVKPPKPRAAAGAVPIDLLDELGAFGITTQSFQNSLRAAGGRPVVVGIDSPGGDVFSGIAIYNLLVQHPADVTVQILGLAASAASLVAMAGDQIQIGENAMLMLHKSWAFTVGNVDDHLDQVTVLNEVDRAMAATYSTRTGISADEIASMMADETWLAGPQAVQRGFATGLLTDAAAQASARFDLSAFRRVPDGLSLKAQPPARGEIKSPVDIERMLVRSGVRNAAARAIAKAGYQELVGAAPRELENLVNQIARATAELKGRK